MKGGPELAGEGCVTQASLPSWQFPFPSMYPHCPHYFSEKTLSVTLHFVTLFSIPPGPYLTLTSLRMPCPTFAARSPGLHFDPALADLSLFFLPRLWVLDKCMFPGNLQLYQCPHHLPGQTPAQLRTREGTSFPQPGPSFSLQGASNHKNTWSM